MSVGRPSAAAEMVGPGWYPDPAGAHQYRYWSGAGWTSYVANGSWVGQDKALREPLSLEPLRARPVGRGLAALARPAPGAESADQGVTLPGRAIWLAVGGVLGSIVLGVAGSLAAAHVAPSSDLADLLLGQSGLWLGFLAPVWIASWRYGTGNVWRDFALRGRGSDVPRGFVVSLIDRFAGLILLVPLVAVNARFAGSDVEPFTKALGHPPLVIALVSIALVGAPIVEELFFRGLVQRCLKPLVGTGGALAGQAVVFASMHLRPSYGLGNLGVFAAIAVMGLVQGLVAERYRRLGPGIASHAFFNLAALLALSVR